MTPATLNTLINLYCGTTDSEFPQAQKLVLINVFKDDFAAEIAKVNEDFFGMELTDDLVAGQRTYNQPDDILNNIKGLEAKLDGVTFQWLREFDLNSWKRPTDEDSILSSFSGKEAMFDIFDRAFTIYSGAPIIDVPGGLKLWAIVYPADITDLTGTTDMSVNPTLTTHGFLRQFHELLGRRVAIAWKSSQDRPKTLTEKEMAFAYDFRSKINAITGGNLDRSIVPTVPRETGENY